MLSVRESLVEPSLLTAKELLLSVCHHQKGGVCEYKIIITKMFLIHGKLNTHTSNKAQVNDSRKSKHWLSYKEQQSKHWLSYKEQQSKHWLSYKEQQKHK